MDQAAALALLAMFDRTPHRAQISEVQSVRPPYPWLRSQGYITTARAPRYGVGQLMATMTPEGEKAFFSYVQDLLTVI